MDTTPWYRQFWPWFLFGLPGVVVVAGLTTWWIAAHNADSVVVDDYYKEGLAINRELGKQQRAQALGLQASLSYTGGALEILLEGDARPAALHLKLSHPIDARRDQSFRMAQVTPGRYRTEASLGSASRWLWQLEPLVAGTDAEWRLDGELRVSHADAQ